MNLEPVSWTEEQKLWFAAVAFVLTASVSLALLGTSPEFVSLVPLPAAAFILKAIYPQIPNLVPAIVAFGTTISVIFIEDDIDFIVFMIVLATVFLAVAEPQRRVVTGYVVVSILTIGSLGATEAVGFGWENWIMGTLFSWTFGTMIFRYERAEHELREAQAQMVDQAALVERRRIARDVHDLVGHSLSVVMLNVAGARRLVRSDPDEAEAALLQAEEAGRTSMAEIRRTIGLMRDDDGEGSAPTPDLTDIEEMVEQYSDAGLDVELGIDGPLDDVEGPSALACYRIAQEALANISKHTNGATVTVHVRVTDTHCHLEVVNRGGRTLAPAGSGSGHGLVGMRERAQSAGGSLIAGPTGDGWMVDASFPHSSGRP